MDGAWLISEAFMKQTCWHKITDHIHTVELSTSEHELQTSIISILDEYTSRKSYMLYVRKHSDYFIHHVFVIET